MASCAGVLRCSVPASCFAASSSKQQRSRGLPQPLQSRKQRLPVPCAVLTAEAAELDVSKMAPLGDRLLVKPREAEAVTAGGILLAGSSKPSLGEALVGTVVAVGEDVDLGLQKGDSVLFSKYGSSDVAVPDGEVCFVAQKSILAKLS